MKRKTVSFLLAMTAAASMSMAAPAAWAADSSAQTTEAEAQGDTAAEADGAEDGAADEGAAETAGTPEDASGAEETPAAEEKVPEDIKLTMESGEVTITNEAEIVFAGAEYVKAEAGDDESKEETWNLVLTEDGENGTVHTFENVTPDKWTDPVLKKEWGCLYIYYKSESGADEEALETADEKELEEKVTVYATTDVNVREKASTDSKSLKVTSLGAEWTATAGVPGWVKVENGDITGYIFHSYISDDKAKVDELVKAAEEARAAAEAAAAQAAADAAWEAQQSQSQPSAPQEVYEVSRQAYDDCDGSGHGYWEIVYSDGSVSYEDY